jgi:hypothetical protein
VLGGGEGGAVPRHGGARLSLDGLTEQMAQGREFDAVIEAKLRKLGYGG